MNPDTRGWPKPDGLRIERPCSYGIATVAIMSARPGFEAHRTVFDEPRIDYVLRGGFRGRYGTMDVEAHPGSLLYRPAGAKVVSRVAPSGLSVFAVAIRNLGEMFREQQQLPPNLLPLMHRACVEHSDPDTTRPLRVESVVGEICAAMGRHEALSHASMPWLDRVIERLRDADSLPPSLDELAEIAGVHFTLVARTFRRRMDCTPGEYARLVRLERVARALADTDVPIASLAFAAGFADQSHLGRHFRRVFGTTPGAYRRSLRGPRHGR